MSEEAPDAAPVDSELFAKRAQMFVDVREKLKAMEDEFEAKCKPIKEAKDLLEGWLMEFLATTGQQSAKSHAGITVFFSSRKSASLADAEAFMRYVIGSEAWELLDRKANATAVEEFITANGEAPPGVNFSKLRTLSVRKSAARKKSNGK